MSLPGKPTEFFNFIKNPIKQLLLLLLFSIKSETSDSFVNHPDGHFAYLKTLDFYIKTKLRSLFVLDSPSSYSYSTIIITTCRTSARRGHNDINSRINPDDDGDREPGADKGAGQCQTAWGRWGVVSVYNRRTTVTPRLTDNPWPLTYGDLLASKDKIM